MILLFHTDFDYSIATSVLFDDIERNASPQSTDGKKLPRKRFQHNFEQLSVSQRDPAGIQTSHAVDESFDTFMVMRHLQDWNSNSNVILHRRFVNGLGK